MSYLHVEIELEKYFSQLVASSSTSYGVASGMYNILSILQITDYKSLKMLLSLLVHLLDNQEETHHCFMYEMFHVSDHSILIEVLTSHYTKMVFQRIADYDRLIL